MIPAPSGILVNTWSEFVVLSTVSDSTTATPVAPTTHNLPSAESDVLPPRTQKASQRAQQVRYNYLHNTAGVIMNVQ